jgi:hypothetical protein
MSVKQIKHALKANKIEYSKVPYGIHLYLTIYTNTRKRMRTRSYRKSDRVYTHTQKEREFVHVDVHACTCVCKYLSDVVHDVITKGSHTQYPAHQNHLIIKSFSFRHVSISLYFSILYHYY